MRSLPPPVNVNTRKLYSRTGPEAKEHRNDEVQRRRGAEKRRGEKAQRRIHHSAGPRFVCANDGLTPHRGRHSSTCRYRPHLGGSQCFLCFGLCLFPRSPSRPLTLRGERCPAVTTGAQEAKVGDQTWVTNIPFQCSAAHSMRAAARSAKLHYICRPSYRVITIVPCRTS